MSIRSFLTARYVLACIVLLLLLIGLMLVITCFDPLSQPVLKNTSEQAQIPWTAPDLSMSGQEPDGELIDYGRQLIEHTSIYLGPKGKVMRISNGMNCQNCHLQSGTKAFGNNYSAVASTYPKFRARSGSVESIEKRVNDCIERSLNGTALGHDKKELKAIVAYITWLGKNVEKGKTPVGGGLPSLPFLDRAASPQKGASIYTGHCAGCHGKNGEGQRSTDAREWTYPPVAGPDSYNTGAGLFRISKFAGFVKANMPFGVTFQTAVLSDEEAWDVAAFVNSLPRPVKTYDQDWPDVSTKPFDYPFGPYADGFDENTHKFGPFTGMKSEKDKLPSN